ncbi:MAG: chromate transporter, partial [Burkholderiaceae bacterium]
VLPGPSVINVSLMVGTQFFGLRGAAASLAGMMLAPLALTLTATALYQHYSQLAAVAGALRGMGAVAAGMIIGTALSLARSYSTSPLGHAVWIVFAGATLVLIAGFKLPLVWVLPTLGLLSCIWAWRQLRRIQA